MNSYSMRRLWKAGPAVTVLAMMTDLFYFLATKAMGEQYLMPMDAGGSTLQPMPLLVPVCVILAAGVMATLLFALLIRYTSRPGVAFLSISITALLLSLGGPLYLPAASLRTKILLSGMHVIATGVISGGILFLSRRDAKST
jgi:hypothetical protein